MAAGKIVKLAHGTLQRESFEDLLKTKDLDYVIASDTDSVYINMEPLVKRLGIDANDKTNISNIVDCLDKFCSTKIQNMINRSYTDLSEYMHAYQQKMFMKRETIANKGIWKARKMYILNALDIEGVRFSEPQLKIMGIEAVRSSTPKSCRDAIKKSLKIIMNEDEETFQKYIADFKTEFMKMSFLDIAFPRGMKGMNKYKDKHNIYAKGTPIHVRGALLYNNMIDKKNLHNQYQMIGDGDKVKFAYLSMPNPLRENVITILDSLPTEFNLDHCINKELQFQKAFVDPIQSIVEVIDWSLEKTNTLESFFG